MARIDDLVGEIRDSSLRRRIEDALATMRRKQRFGLVFEDHVPETTSLQGFPISTGSIVQRRDDPEGRALYRVVKVNGRGKATLQPSSGGEEETAQVRDLMVVKRFGDPIYPALTPLGSVQNGPADRPYHAVVNGENFHALQLFAYLYEGKADCIYIDPPYNTGARDWKYNNRYVDKNDTWRHSKWLSMMEKRLHISKRLLKHDGVLICTIDEHEVNHLAMLLEKVFQEYEHYMVTIVINPKGREKENFAPVEEYALFVVPKLGEDVILRAPKVPASQPNLFDFAEAEAADADINGQEEPEEMEDEAEAQEEPDVPDEAADIEWEIRHARRRGGGAERSSYREKRWNQFYPIYIDEENRKVVRAGESIPLGQKPSFKKVDGLRPLWPIDKEGEDRCWAFVSTSMQKLIDAGHVFLGKYHPKRDDWTINYRIPKKTSRKLKTVWWETIHDAGTHGTQLLKKFLGQGGLFPFPKSVYAVRDCIAAVVRNRPDALIIDFFAGSGTTLHSACLLNIADGGRRRTVMVTNNEVAEKLATKLNGQGIYSGDPEFERHGIFEAVTRPRCTATVTGQRADGTPVPGKHVDAHGKPKGRPMSEGFPENVEFFRIDYLDADEVDLGHQFDAILPSLWLAAGATGPRKAGASRTVYTMPEGSTYGVLFRESGFRKFKDALAARPDVTHVWLVTDSEEAYAEMRSKLPSRVLSSMLYRDYLRNFRINTGDNL